MAAGQRKGRDGKGSEGKGREGKGREGKGRVRLGQGQRTEDGAGAARPGEALGMLIL